MLIETERELEGTAKPVRTNANCTRHPDGADKVENCKESFNRPNI